MKQSYLQHFIKHSLHISVAALCLILIFGGVYIFVNEFNQQNKPVQKSQNKTSVSQRNVLAGTTIGCFSGGWNARKKITFNNSSSSTLINFPVLVKIDANRINYSKTYNNGSDLRFEDPSSPGTWLPHEIETWNSSGASYIWVRVPQVDPSTSDYIWMYYDNPSAADGQQRSLVWDSSYRGVWHLGSIFYDSTSNANHGTNNNTTSSEGLMGNATNFAGTSTADQYVSIPNSASINFSNSQNYTIEAWVKLPQDQNYRTYPDNDIISKWTHDTSPPVNPYPYNMRTTNSSSGGGAGEIYSNRYDANGKNPNCSSLPSRFNNNSWLHVAAIKNGSNISMYINGTAYCSTTDTTTTTTTNSDPLHFGRRVSPRNWLTGSIDEVRISSTNRSSDWVKAEYNTARDSMNTFGAEEICTTTDTSTIIAIPTPTPTLFKLPTPTLTKTQTSFYAPTPTTYISNIGTGSTNIGGYAYPTATTQSQTIQQFTQTGVNTSQTTNQIVNTSASNPVDRLASQDPTTLKCISSLLSADELNRLRYLQPQIPSEETELNMLQEKVKVCFQTYTDVVKIQEASRQISELPQEIKQCVVKAVGLPAYEEIQSGVRVPTQQEKVNSQGCFAAQPPQQITYQTKEAPLSTTVDTCLVLALGTDKFAQIKANKILPTLSDKEKINRCFGVNPNPLTGKPKYVIPPDIDACVRQGVTEARYQAIKAGQEEPTKQDREKANSCFSKLNQLQTQLLSAPPAQVPYLRNDITTVKIDNVTPTTEKTANAKTDNIILLRGRSLPNALISVYVFSDPIVVETQTDQNGEWVYKFNEPLDKGSHLAYATTRTATGEQVRSSVFNFNVVNAAEPASGIGQQYFEENKASSVPSKFFDSSLIMIGGALLLGVITFMIIILKNQQPKPAVVPNSPNTPNSTGGKSNGENTSSPIN